MLGAKLLFVTVAVIGANPAPANSDPGPLTRWSTTSAIPELPPAPRNIVRLDGDRLLWNGGTASESQVRLFLDVIAKQLRPQPLTVLTYSARTSPERIQRVRLMMEQVGQCTPGVCLEVTTPRD